MVAIPQSGLLSHVSSLRFPLWHSGQILTLSTADHASLPSPRLLVAGAGVCAASPLGEYRWACNLWVLIIYLFFLPVMSPSVLPRLAADSAVRVFPGVWNFSRFETLFLGRSSIPTYFVSFFLSFIFFPTSFQRQWAAFLVA